MPSTHDKLQDAERIALAKRLFTAENKLAALARKLAALEKAIKATKEQTA